MKYKLLNFIYQNILNNIQSKKNQLKNCEGDLKNSKWEYEVLLQRFEIVRQIFIYQY